MTSLTTTTTDNNTIIINPQIHKESDHFFRIWESGIYRPITKQTTPQADNWWLQTLKYAYIS